MAILIASRSAAAMLSVFMPSLVGQARRPGTAPGARVRTVSIGEAAHPDVQDEAEPRHGGNQG
jgi:hypothetical protein